MGDGLIHVDRLRGHDIVECPHERKRIDAASVLRFLPFCAQSCDVGLMLACPALASRAYRRVLPSSVLPSSCLHSGREQRK